MLKTLKDIFVGRRKVKRLQNNYTSGLLFCHDPKIIGRRKTLVVERFWLRNAGLFDLNEEWTD